MHVRKAIGGSSYECQLVLELWVPFLFYSYPSLQVLCHTFFSALYANGMYI